MKTLLSPLAGAALIGAVVSFSTPAVQAKQEAAPAVGAIPVGLRCIVTLDPRATGHTPVFETQQKSGLSGEHIVEGHLVSMGDEWLVLKDGTYENWIPRDKVLLMRVSR